MAKEMIAMLLAGGQGSRLYALTQKLAKPAVPFGGKYRIIDFPLSNCVNSGIDTVGILTQYQNTTTAILFEQIVQQPVVLETFYRDYLSAKRRPSAKVGEQRFHDVNIFLIDVTKLGSIVFHRLNIQLLREFSVYRAMWAVGKIINC